jgi:hypothetical protein
LVVSKEFLFGTELFGLSFARYMTKCIVCSSPTTNPKFCSRSCAAKHNNTTAPKRKPEGKCLKCKSPITTKSRYCKACLEQLRVEQAREAENIRRWKTISGDWSEEGVEKVEARKRTVYSVEGNVGRIGAHEPTGRLLDTLIGLCFSGPEYLRPDDAARYIALLQELKRFNCEIWRGVKRVSMEIRDVPIDDLGMVIEDWIISYFDDNRCSLLPAFALDTAMFIGSHMSGHCQYHPALWEIKPIVEPPDRNFRLDAQFKSNFTSRFGRIMVRCKVPDACVIEFQGKALVSAGEEFCALIKRCHLSANFQDAIFLHTQFPEEATIDLGFTFVGEILLNGGSSISDWLSDSESHPIQPVLVPEHGQSLYSCRLMDLNIPGNWIHSAGQCHSNEFQLRPMPRWSAEIGETRHVSLATPHSSVIQ